MQRLCAEGRSWSKTTWVTAESPGICTERPRPAGSPPIPFRHPVPVEPSLRPRPRCWSPALSPRQGGVAAKWESL